MEYKTRVYLITFVSYVGIHSLRTTYSFSKKQLANTFVVDQSDLGIVDSLMIYALAIGFFQQAIFPFKKPVLALAVGLLMSALIYSLVPFSIVDLQLHYFSLLVIIMSVDGYFQSYAWPNLLMLVNSQFDNKKQSIKLGFWVTNTNFGNILGFVLCQYLVIRNQLPWQLSMYLVAIFIIVCSLLVFFFIRQLPEVGPSQIGSLTETKYLLSNSDIQDVSPTENIKQILKQPVVILMTASFALLKSIEYGILLWIFKQLPIYFDLKGLVEYSAFIPITFDVASIFSSIGLGFAFRKVQNKGLLLGPLILVLMVLFVCLRFIDGSVPEYFVLISGVGVCLGGTYNTMGGLVAMQLVKAVPIQFRTKYLGFYSAVLMCAANLITASTQILIGYVVGKNESLIFTIFFWYSAVSLVMLIAVGVIERVRPPVTSQSQVTIEIASVDHM